MLSNERENLMKRKLGSNEPSIKFSLTVSEFEVHIVCRDDLRKYCFRPEYIRLYSIPDGPCRLDFTWE